MTPQLRRDVFAVLALKLALIGVLYVVFVRGADVAPSNAQATAAAVIGVAPGTTIGAAVEAPR